MATTRSATTQWKGPLLGGAGTVSLDTSDVTWASRAEEANGKTSPEELIAAAHSSCYSMALSHALAGAGTPPETVQTRAAVTFQPGEGITGITLSVQARVPGISAEDFEAAAQGAKANCPVSKALTGTTITLEAELLS
jgi:osmotically inducible protein OsmC